MAKELPYFKFFPGKWMTGDITLQEQNIQGIFINVCAVYWSKKCNLAIDRLKQRYGEAIDTLLKLELIKLDGTRVLIDFLDEQWIELNSDHTKNVENGKKGAKKRWSKNSPPVALREDKKREDKIIPTEIEFMDFCKTIKEINFEAYSFSLKSKYESWVEAGWKDGNGNEIKKWKSKIKNTIPYLKPTQVVVNQTPKTHYS